MLRSRSRTETIRRTAMTAVITASRWNAIHPDYKSGSPSEGTAGILRLTTDLGTVLVPTEVVDRQRLFAFGPLVATPGALRALVAEGADPARLLARHGAGDWGALCAEDHDANDEAVRSGAAHPQRLRPRIHPPVDHHRRRDRRPAGPSGVRPRYATTLLLPSEY